MAGIQYVLQSAMLYHGSGRTGIWTCFVKEAPGYVFYDDRASTIILDEVQLTSYL